MVVDFEKMQRQLERQGSLIEELYKIISENAQKPPVQTIEDKPMNVDEASLYLGISVQTIYTNKTIPRHKPSGKRVFFLRSEPQSYVMGKPIKS